MTVPVKFGAVIFVTNRLLPVFLICKAILAHKS